MSDSELDDLVEDSPELRRRVEERARRQGTHWQRTTPRRQRSTVRHPKASTVTVRPPAQVIELRESGSWEIVE